LDEDTTLLDDGEGEGFCFDEVEAEGVGDGEKKGMRRRTAFCT
jgi:hypothetical protein